MRMLKGGCYCGTCRYEVPDRLEFAQFCHCRDCQKRSGTGYTVFGRTRKDAIAFAPEATLGRYGDDGGALYFCSTCGSPLFATFDGDELAHLQLGTLDDEPTTQPSSHIFASRRRPWDTIEDGLPQYREHVHQG